MKVRVNKDICIGCGACTCIADTTFEIGDDGLAEAMAPYIDEDTKTKEVTEEVKTDVLDAADGCPVGAIEVVEE